LNRFNDKEMHKRKYPSLEPDFCLKTKKTEYYSVADIEATDWIGFLVIGHYDKYSKRFRYFEKLKDYIDFLFEPENSTSITYFHNGGRYDFLFLLKEILSNDDYLVDSFLPRGSSILSFDISLRAETAHYDKKKEKWVNEFGGFVGKRSIIRIKKGICYYKARTIQFRDSIAILPFSLDSLCQNFHVEHKKMKIDYSKIRKVTPELIKYLEYDCKGLNDVIEKYHEWPLIKKSGTAFTMASQALKVFRTYLKEPIMSLPLSVDDFVRPAYFGGRTEIFKPLFWGDKDNLLSCYDVNSLYPTVMLGEMPTNFECFTHKYYPNRMGFYNAEVEVPTDMYIPPLGIVFNVNNSEKFIFPTGRFKGRWTTIELEYAKSLGVKIIKIGDGAIFNNGGKIFEDYILDLYKIRENSPKESVDNILAKLLMNSCYGRMGLRRDRESIVFDHGQAGIRILAELPYKSLKNTVVRIGLEEKHLDNSFSNVAIAAWVTSLARIHMHKIYMQAPEKLYYSDTDSAYTTKKYKDDKKLGGLKFEYACDSACFLLPKTYLVSTIDNIFKAKNSSGETIMENKKVVMKGFSKESINMLEMDDFHDALEGELRLMKVKSAPNGIVTFKKMIKEKHFSLLKVSNTGKGIKTFRTAARSGNLLQKNESSDRMIKSIYDKRKIIKTIGGKLDTEPLVIREGKIINL